MLLTCLLVLSWLSVCAPDASAVQSPDLIEPSPPHAGPHDTFETEGIFRVPAPRLGPNQPAGQTLRSDWKQLAETYLQQGIANRNTEAEVARTTEMWLTDAVAPGLGLGWQSRKVIRSPKRTYVHLLPAVDGRPILGSPISVVWENRSDRVTVRGPVPILDTPSTLALHPGTPSELDVPGAVRSIEEAWVSAAAGFTPIIRVELAVGSPPALWETWLHAETKEILYREPLGAHVEGRITARVETRTVDDTVEEFPLPLANVFVQESEGDRVEETVTDANGRYELGTSGGSDLWVGTELAGPRVQIQDGNLGFETPQLSVMLGTNEQIDFSWTEELAGPSARDAFFHANESYNYVRTLDPSSVLDSLDSPMPIRVDDGAGVCNAFFDGVGLTFYAAGAGCESTARIADVVHHEYGHAVSASIYRPFRIPRDMDEAFSDFYAATITGRPKIGLGILGPETFFRELESDRRWPEDQNIIPHLQGLILSGALWDLRELVGSEVADPLFHFARYGLSDSFDQFFLDLLAEDDDDGILENGTPHFDEIIAAFRPHGIGDYSVRIEGGEIADTEILDEGIPAQVTIRSLLGLEAGGVRFHYRRSNESTFTEATVLTGSGLREFEAVIPAPAEETVFDYYWTAVDTAGTVAAFPPDAPESWSTFRAGPDTTPPVLAHQPIEYLSSDQSELPIEVVASDNSGSLREVAVDFRIDDQPGYTSIPLTGAGTFRGYLPTGTLGAGREVHYRVRVTDGSLSGNTSLFPAEGELTIQVVAGRTFPLESDDGGFTSSGDWAWGEPSSAPLPPFGTRVWATNLGGNYSPGTVSTLVVGPIPVNPAGTAQLQFRHYHDFVNGIDGGQMAVSGNGTSWRILRPADGYSGSFVEAFQDEAYTGSTDGWEEVQVALDQIFPTNELWLRFRVRSTGATSSAGWYLDDLRVSQVQAKVPPHSLTAVSGESEQVRLEWDDPYSVDLTGGTFLGYRIYRRLSGDEFSDEPLVPLQDETRYTDRSVQNDLDYDYRLHAVYESGESPGITVAARPAAPALLFPEESVAFSLIGKTRSDITLTVRNDGNGRLEYNAYLLDEGESLDDVRIRVDLEALSEKPTVVLTDAADASGNPDLAEVRMSKWESESNGPMLRVELVGHSNWGNAAEDFGGILLFDTDDNLATRPSPTVFGWDEDLNHGWDTGVLFGAIATGQGSPVPALLVHAEDLDTLVPLTDRSFPETGNRVSFSVPLRELADAPTTDINVIFSRSRLSEPFDRAPELPRTKWLIREPRHGVIRAQSTRPFSLEFDARNLGNGVSRALIYFTTNDPSRREFELPVELTVQGTIPTDPADRSFRSTPDGMEVSFTSPRGLTPLGAQIERSPADDPIWTILNDGELEPDEENRFFLLDSGVVPGSRYIYRFRARFQGFPDPALFGPYEVTYQPPLPTRFAFGISSPNPFMDTVSLQLELPEASFARVEVFDVQGRRVESLLADDVAAGIYIYDWRPRENGIYWARAVVPGRFDRVLRLVRTR